MLAFDFLALPAPQLILGFALAQFLRALSCAGSVELVDVSKRLPGLKRVNGLSTWRVMDKVGAEHCACSLLLSLRWLEFSGGMCALR